MLAIIGAVAAVAGIAFAVYRFFAPDYLEDFEEDFDDDFRRLLRGRRRGQISTACKEGDGGCCEIRQWAILHSPLSVSQ